MCDTVGKVRGQEKVITFNVRVGYGITDDETNNVFYVDNDYTDVFVNEDEFSEEKRKKNQFMVVDIGCPRSLLGRKEYERFLKSLPPSERRRIREDKASEKFRFGPSRTYESRSRIEIPMNIKGERIKAKFFVVEGDNIPILMGNDILEPLGAVIYTETGVIEFVKVGQQIAMNKTRGGHFVIPVDEIKDETVDISEDTPPKNNILGFEADAVMLVLFTECDEEDEYWKLNEIMGHKNFVAMMLEEDEGKQIQKVHRYFGHRSPRRVWEMFAKAGKLRNKKKAALELLDKCKICRETKKTPARPKVGMPTANNWDLVIQIKVFIVTMAQNFSTMKL